MENVPSLYFLRGDDPSRFRQVIASCKASLGASDLADLNTSRLDGLSLSPEKLIADAAALPFLAARRLVIVEDAREFLTRFSPEGRARFLTSLAGLPNSTALMLLVEDSLTRRRGERYWEHSQQYDWVLDWVRANPAQALLVDCSLPDEEEMPSWILKQAKAQGGTFRTDAAYRLAGLVGNDTLRAQLEIDKLISYAGSDQAVTVEDVDLLTAQAHEGNIFALTDALGERNGSKALQQFRRLTADSDVLEISGMIHRQFRQLIQAREILDEGKNRSDVERELKLPSFVADKLSSQARRFTMDQLLAIFGRLLKIDEDMKSGGLAGDAAFELLIADLTR